MRNAILLHGTGCSPHSYWFPAIKKFLEGRNYEVWAPELPDSDKPELKIQLPFILENGKFNEETILIGHSAGCALILSVLQNINVKTRKTILVSGFARKLKKGSGTSLILQKKYDWERIKGNTREIIFINSDNDPWGCDDKEGDYMFRKLGGTLILRHGEGHMGSDAFNQPYKEFPLIEKLIMLD